MPKIMTVVGTRPEIIKMSRLISILDQCTDHVLVHTGQNYDYELNQIFFDDLQIRKPDHFLDANGTPAETIAQVIAKTDVLLDSLKPDAFLIYGDTNSCLSVIAAKRKKIPVFHMEAGNRCFDQRVPEEINRKIVDHLSDINFVLSEHARRYLLAEGLPGDRIIKTGSHLKEILSFYQDKINHSDILEKLNVTEKSYITVSLHREENVDEPENIAAIPNILKTLAERYNKKIIVSLHPRTRERLNASDVKFFDPRIQFHKPFSFSEYIMLQKKAFCVLSDSGTITEEASLLNLPAVNLRYAHERPEGMDSGVTIMCQLGRIDRICHAIDVVTKHRHDFPNRLKIVPDYEVEMVSQKILQVVLSYIDFINRIVWSKP